MHSHGAVTLPSLIEPPAKYRLCRGSASLPGGKEGAGVGMGAHTCAHTHWQEGRECELEPENIKSINAAGGRAQKYIKLSRRDVGRSVV